MGITVGVLVTVWGGGGVNARGGSCSDTSEILWAIEKPLQKEKSLLMKSFDYLQACRLRFHECGWKCCVKVCLSSFCTSERASGKSIMRARSSVNPSWLDNHGPSGCSLCFLFWLIWAGISGTRLRAPPHQTQHFRKSFVPYSIHVWITCHT